MIPVLPILFVVLSLIVLGAALMVVTNRNIFHSALYLILAFVGVAGLYILLEAEFLAGVQVLVYVGAVAVLILFAIMLSGRYLARPGRQLNEQWPLAAIFAALFFGVLVFVLLQVPWATVEASVPADYLAQLGQDLMGPYLLPFEVASVLLLVAMIGAILIARER
ncbi:MAG: NADH-quinone oxidoreductase subunit J family protein [Anaerolineae bacterium]